MIVVGDTGGLIAALNRSDADHEGAARALDRASLTVISPLVLTEVHQVLTTRVSRRAADTYLATLARRADGVRVLFPATTPQLIRDAVAVRQQYADLNLDLADAVVAVLAAEYATNAILTVDRRDFHAMRPVNGTFQHFRIVTDEL